ncbi:MAG: hypothetical protein JWL72_4269 [Ilumatobacteraceae bacterium]|nr:hypothetical protein [Ilumatobacteraceae bacterium]MCU1390931.1 hypothetical protein [Ilumatobacteraceae bacterium]
MGKLNGKPSNGHADSPVTLPIYDHMREPEATWPRADDAWPAASPGACDLERPRLEAEIAAAKARAASARHRAAQRDAQMRAALRVELEASQERLAAMEREHEAAVAAVLADAQAKAARIVAEARQQLSSSSAPRGRAETAQVISAE